MTWDETHALLGLIRSLLPVVPLTVGQSVCGLRWPSMIRHRGGCTDEGSEPDVRMAYLH